MARVTVVGEHWSTLSAAARLAVSGHDVALISTQPVNSASLNITLPAALRDLFLKTGAPLEERIELQDLDTMFSINIDGTSFSMPGVGIGAAVSAVTSTCGTRSGAQWKTLMSQAQVRWDSIRLTAEDPHPNKQRSRWKQPQSLSRALRGKTQAVQEIMHTSIAREGYATNSLVIDYITVPYVASTFGMYSVNGGNTALHQALLDRCLELGVHRHESIIAADVTITDSRYEQSPVPNSVDLDNFRRVGPQVAMSVLAGSAVSKAINERLLLNGG